jgi:3-methyladenine DNA glycosylase AlkD
MTRLELRDLIKGILDDSIGEDSEQYWSPASLNLYINEALDEIAKRTKCIKDSINPLYTQIPLVANQVHYPYPNRVIEIISISRSWDGRPLRRTVASEVIKNPLWRQVTNEPQAFLTDFSTDTISLVGRLETITDQKLEMSVYRLPIVLTSDSQKSDVPERFHTKSINWVLYRCFSKEDAHVKDYNKASHHLKGFQGEPSENGKGGDIQQIITQMNQFHPHVSKCRFF